jgi:hypothetical protein
MDILTKKIEQIEKLKRELSETKMQATYRIKNEWIEEKKLAARKKVVMAYFKELTGEDMGEARFMIYNEKFNRAEVGWNIKSYIKELGLKCIEDHTKVEHINYELYKKENEIITNTTE